MPLTPKHRNALLGFGLVLMMTAINLAWSKAGGLALCIAFWLAAGFAVGFLAVRGPARNLWIALIPGATLNALATIANRGAMPVRPFMGMPVPDAAHVLLGPRAALIGLADIYHGFSIGDMLICLAWLPISEFGFFRLSKAVGK